MLRYLKKIGSIYFIVPLVCLLFYMGLIKIGDKYLDLGPHLNYFRNLADAFLHGRLNLINPPSRLDLVSYDEKLYLYWPPVPALIYMPLVAIFGMKLPDAFISSLFGITNVWLLMRICSHLSEKFFLSLTSGYIAWIGLFWGLGTVHFYISKDGSVWFIAQVMAQTFLLSSVYFFLKESRISLIISGLCFALAAYTRNDLVFSIFFLIFLYVAMNQKMEKKETLKKGIIFIIPFILFSLLNGWYNYARFGNIFENGINFHSMNPYFLDNFRQFGYFSWHYFPHNFFTEVLHLPTIFPHPPFIKIEPEGFGFIWGSPVFLLLIPAAFFWIKNLLKKNSHNRITMLIKTGTIASAIPIASVIFLIMGTGWIQFCARYTLDFQFFLLIFLLFSWKELAVIRYIKPLTIFLILVSVVVQYIGAWHQNIAWIFES